MCLYKGFKDKWWWLDWYWCKKRAWCWFNVKLFKNECIRILKPNGKVFLIWNLRDNSSEMTQRCFVIYKKYCPKFKGFGGGIQKDDIRIKEFFAGKYENNRGKIRSRYNDLTRKFLAYNDKEENPDAFLRKPQFEALEMYVCVKEFMNNQ